MRRSLASWVLAGLVCGQAHAAFNKCSAFPSLCSGGGTAHELPLMAPPSSVVEPPVELGLPGSTFADILDDPSLAHDPLVHGNPGNHPAPVADNPASGQPIAEPGTLALLGIALAGLAFNRLKRAAKEPSQ